MPYREPQDGDRLVCPKCPESVEVSTEDPDASFSEMVHHLRWSHSAHNLRVLMRQTVLEDRDGNTVKEG